MNAPILARTDATAPGRLLAEFTELENPHYTVLTLAYLLGQYRIQLTDKRRPDEYAPPGHGTIIREMCTYQGNVALIVMNLIAASPDPEAYCRSLERPYNCKHPGGRIRLDNHPPPKE